MDPNTAMETIGAGAKAATKIGEIVEKVFGPRLTRKQADADAYADEKKLQTIRNNPDMEIVYYDGKINARLRTQDALAFRAEQRLFTEAMRQESNIENVLEIAEKELAHTETVSDEPVDDDWITRFFSTAKDVSNEEMQYIWGKILAGEIASPNSFSLRTLDVLRNLSQLEASTFQKVLPLVLQYNRTSFICSEKDIYQKQGVSYHDIMILDECGLMVQNSMVSLNIEMGKENSISFLTDDYYLKIRCISGDGVNLSIRIYSLTHAGCELYRILSSSTNYEYITDFANYIYKNKEKRITLDIYKVNHVSDGMINYQIPPVKSYKSDDATCE